MTVGKQKELPLFGEVKPLKLGDISQIPDFQTAVVMSSKQSPVARTDSTMAELMGFANGGSYNKFYNGTLSKYCQHLVRFTELTNATLILQMLCEKLGFELVPKKSKQALLEDELERLQAQIKLLKDNAA